jgi:transposase
MSKYDDEFKRNAVRLVLDGQSVRSVSQELGVNESQIHKWKRAALANGDGAQSGTELRDTAALKKRIRELEMENEILKKAALIFGRGS